MTESEALMRIRDIANKNKVHAPRFTLHCKLRGHARSGSFVPKIVTLGLEIHGMFVKRPERVSCNPLAHERMRCSDTLCEKDVKRTYAKR